MSERPYLKGEKFEEIELNTHSLQHRAIRSALKLVKNPFTYLRACLIYKNLLNTDHLPPKIISQLFIGIEHASCAIAMQNEENFDENIWKDLMNHVFERKDKFTQPQLAKLEKWSNKDFSDIIESRKSTYVNLEKPPNRLRYAETVLKYRTNRFAIVLERPYDDFNQQAIIRTADCFGIQNLFIIDHKSVKNASGFSSSVTKNTGGFMSINKFETTKECIEYLRKHDYTIWVTDLSPQSVRLDSEDLVIPEKVAIVFGRETDGCSEEIINAADLRIYIPIYGFAESLNLSVAAALTMQYLFFKCPEARGNLSEDEKHELRKSWYYYLSRKSEKKRAQFMSWVDSPPEPLEDLRREEKDLFVSKKIKNRLLEENGRKQKRIKTEETD